MDLTLDEKVSTAEQIAREKEAEKHFYDEAIRNGFKPHGYSVIYRNPGHWDIIADQVPGKASAWRHANPKGFTSAQDGGRERAFAIRGEPGKVYVRDERWNPHRPFPREPLVFRSVAAAMLYVSDELMPEANPALDALKRLEEACNALCGARTPEQQKLFEESGQEDLLNDLDKARREARELLKGRH